MVVDEIKPETGDDENKNKNLWEKKRLLLVVVVR